MELEKYDTLWRASILGNRRKPDKSKPPVATRDTGISALNGTYVVSLRTQASRKSGNAEPLVVPTTALGDVIRRFCVDHDRQHPTGRNAEGIPHTDLFCSALDF